ncbi:DUF4238 domain-containing protein [Flavobacterium sp.]|uniref:DUF4238 domain-containing protein n=1 Tax=Flavobacterium TaxID=237 RepID=UPI0031CFE292
MKKSHQHFIPQTYLKKFAHTVDNKNYFVAVYDKISGKYNPKMSVGNLCVETDLYTLDHLNGDEKYAIENFFSDNIENRYPKVFKLLVEDKKPIISSEEKTFILYTTLSMYFRTPKVLNQFVDFAGRLVENVKNGSSAKSIDFLGYKISLDQKSFTDIKKDIRATNRIDFLQTQLALLDALVEFKFNDGLVITELIGEQEFITSDNPVEIRNMGEIGFNLFSDRNSIYIPLDPKHALFIAPKDKGSITNEVFYQKDNFVQHITLNHVLFKNAERWIIGSSKGVQQFLKDEEEYTKPVEDNHPMLVKFRMKLKLMEDVLQQAEKGVSNENLGLIESLHTLKKSMDEPGSEDLQDLYNKFKETGLKLD